MMENITRKFVITTPNHCFGPMEQNEFENVFEKISKLIKDDTEMIDAEMA